MQQPVHHMDPSLFFQHGDKTLADSIRQNTPRFTKLFADVIDKLAAEIRAADGEVSRLGCLAPTTEGAALPAAHASLSPPLTTTPGAPLHTRVWRASRVGPLY